MRHFNREKFQSLILTIEAALIIISLATGSDAKVGMLCYWSIMTMYHLTDFVIGRREDDGREQTD